ncbi:MAG: DNA-directed RNA polymerase subunit K [Candidatus Thermoplasmatota archaeon]
MEYTRYEKARIIGARALQISMGAPSTLTKLPKDMIDPVRIAMLEFEEGAIPITVRRKK